MRTYSARRKPCTALRLLAMVKFAKVRNPMNAADSFWNTVPRKSLIVFLLGVFFLFSTLGSSVGLFFMGSESPPRFVLRVLLYGVFDVLYAIIGFLLRRRFLWTLFPLIVVEIVFLSSLFPSLPGPTQMGVTEIARLHHRLILSGAATIAGMGLGYACFVYFVISEGRRYFGDHAEIELATEIHRVLVGPIDTRIRDFEFYGRSVPSGQVGGDLIDVVQGDRGWIAYVADVSGHGVAAGVVMGMVKSAARMQLSSGEGSDELLERLNSVLHPIIKPEMFVTFAYLAWNGEQLDYALAGHPPILHYRAATKDISELACSNLPLGMFGGRQFVSGSVEYAPGDLFLLLTDGLLEVTNAKDGEFGLAGVTAAMATHASRPINTVSQAVMDASARHGRVTDDQSLLLVRCHARST
jgi:Stage II sporulation protein E (SpoIIE)